MGCASSSPLVESGKKLVDTAKDQAGEVVSKGEQTMQDVGETISTEMDHVKEAMQSALNTAENSIGSMMGKVGNNIDSKTSEMTETVNNMEEDAEDGLNVISDSATEAVSEAETVLASEVDNAKEMVSSTTSEAFEKVDSTKRAMDEKVNEAEENIENALHIEDMEHFDVLGDSVNNVEKKVEEIVAKLPTPATSPVKEPQKEQPPPTFWEAAADAIVEQKSFSASVDVVCESEVNKENGPTDNMIIEPDLVEGSKDKLSKEFVDDDLVNNINEQK